LRIVLDVPLKIDVPCKWASFQWNVLYLDISGLESMEFVRLIKILFLSFRRVVNVIYSFLGNSPASEI